MRILLKKVVLLSFVGVLSVEASSLNITNGYASDFRNTKKTVSQIWNESLTLGREQNISAFKDKKSSLIRRLESSKQELGRIKERVSGRKRTVESSKYEYTLLGELWNEINKYEHDVSNVSSIFKIKRDLEDKEKTLFKDTYKNYENEFKTAKDAIQKIWERSLNLSRISSPSSFKIESDSLLRELDFQKRKLETTQNTVWRTYLNNISEHSEFKDLSNEVRDCINSRAPSSLIDTEQKIKDEIQRRERAEREERREGEQKLEESEVERIEIQNKKRKMSGDEERRVEVFEKEEVLFWARVPKNEEEEEAQFKEALEISEKFNKELLEKIKKDEEGEKSLKKILESSEKKENKELLEISRREEDELNEAIRISKEEHEKKRQYKPTLAQKHDMKSFSLTKGQFINLFMNSSVGDGEPIEFNKSISLVFASKDLDEVLYGLFVDSKNTPYFKELAEDKTIIDSTIFQKGSEIDGVLAPYNTNEYLVSYFMAGIKVPSEDYDREFGLFAVVKLG